MLNEITNKIDELESKYAEEAVDGKKHGWVKLAGISMFDGICNGIFFIGWIVMILGVINSIKKLFHRG